MLVIPERRISRTDSAELPRLGQINFVNCLPIVVPMKRNDWNAQAEVFYATPSELNHAFASEKLDIGAMSSFHFLKDGTMKLVDGLAIASDGAVASVMCHSKKPLEQLNGARVAVPLSSATSVNLLQVLLKEAFNVIPELVYREAPNVELEDMDAALVIGDQALRAEMAWDKKLVRADLGEWWRIITGLPMVFGLWAARSEWAVKNADSFTAISETLRAAVQCGLGPMFEDVVQEGCTRTGMSHERIVKYFKRDLDFRMTPRHLEGLALYGKLCQKHNLFQSEP
jgi:chorismate dehydratase